jgi:hypothetical protein
VYVGLAHPGARVREQEVIEVEPHANDAQVALKKIVVRKAGAVRLTRMCSSYCYGCCCCGGVAVA